MEMLNCSFLTVLLTSSQDKSQGLLQFFDYITLTVLFMSCIITRQSELKKEVSNEPTFPPTRMNGLSLEIGSQQEAISMKLRTL